MNIHRYLLNISVTAAVLLPISTTLAAQDYSRSVAAQCREEASGYGLTGDQLEEYTNGCIVALGGIPPVTENDAAPASSDEPPANAVQTGEQ